MTQGQILRLIHSIVLAQRRAKRLRCAKLTRALDDAGYYAGRELGARLAAERHVADGETTDAKGVNLSG